MRIPLIIFIGFMLITIMFWGPVLMMILGELLCGGVVVLGQLTEILGELGVILSGCLIAVCVVYLIYRPAVRGMQRKMRQPHISNDQASTEQKIVDYIQQMQLKNYDRAAIHESLLRAGWSEKQIVQAFTSAAKR